MNNESLAHVTIRVWAHGRKASEPSSVGHEQSHSSVASPLPGRTLCQSHSSCRALISERLCQQQWKKSYQQKHPVLLQRSLVVSGEGFWLQRENECGWIDRARACVFSDSCKVMDGSGAHQTNLGTVLPPNDRGWGGFPCQTGCFLCTAQNCQDY